MAEVVLRAPTVADAEQIARVLNAHGLATDGEATESPAGVAAWFDLDELDPARDMRVAVDAAGAVLGYGDVSDQGGLHTAFSIDVRVSPLAPLSAALLLDAMEERAGTLAGAGAVARLFVGEGDTHMQRLAAERGYRVVRSSYRMEIDLVGDLPDPVWPEGISPRVYEPKHEGRVYEANQEAFEGHWGFTRQSIEQWRSWNLGPTNDTSLWRIAWDGDEVAGLAINRSERGEGCGWVATLAVRVPWRRRGLGTALLLDAFQTFRGLGRGRAALGVDAENATGAVHLYEAAGMHVASRHDTWERPIRCRR